MRLRFHLHLLTACGLYASLLTDGPTGSSTGVARAIKVGPSTTDPDHQANMAQTDVDDEVLQAEEYLA